MAYKPFRVKYVVQSGPGFMSMAIILPEKVRTFVGYSYTSTSVQETVNNLKSAGIMVSATLTKVDQNKNPVPGAVIIIINAQAD